MIRSDSGIDVNEHLTDFSNKIANNDLVNSSLNPEVLKEFITTGIGKLIDQMMKKDREFHLEVNGDDSANGYCPVRTLNVGTLPIPLTIPRTRSGFYPEILPKYQRYIPEDYQKLLYDILINAKSFNATLMTMKQLGMGGSETQLNELLETLYEEAKTFSNRPLDPDWLFVYADAKVIHLYDPEDKKVKKASHFIVVGVSMDGRKEILLNTVYKADESVDLWRKTLLNLRNRGLTRVLMIITDDFSGLSSLIDGLFPNADHQLCNVHLLRNARRHLDKKDYALFNRVLKEIYTCASYNTALTKFTDLCAQLEKKNTSYIKYIQPRADLYLNFTHYPPELWASLKSTNIPEGLNNAIETIKRNAGGHFHSERELMVKMNLLTQRLIEGKWKKASPIFAASLQPLTSIFMQRFENEINDEKFFTQNS